MLYTFNYSGGSALDIFYDNFVLFVHWKPDSTGILKLRSVNRFVQVQKHFFVQIREGSENQPHISVG